MSYDIYLPYTISEWRFTVLIIIVIKYYRELRWRQRPVRAASARYLYTRAIRNGREMEDDWRLAKRFNH